MSIFDPFSPLYRGSKTICLIAQRVFYYRQQLSTKLEGMTMAKAKAEQVQVHINLWQRMTNELDEYGVDCRTPRAVEGEKIYEDMRVRFRETLNAAQAQAFDNLMSLADAERWGNREEGVALGLALAKGLNRLLHEPADAYQGAVATYYNPFESSYDREIRELNEYLKKTE
jgi:hypothetical protein